MNAHSDATPPVRDAAAPFPSRPHALFDHAHASLPPPPPPPAATLSHAPPPPMPPPRPPDAAPAALAAAAAPPHDKLHAAYVHRPVVGTASYLYPLHHQMMTPVAHVPIGAAHYAHLPPSIWPPPHQYPPPHLPHHSVVAHMQPSYSLQHPAPVAYTYAPFHNAPLPSIKPPPAQDPYAHQSIHYHPHQHHVLHQSSLPPSHPSHHQHANAPAAQSASMPLEITPAPIAPPSAPRHAPEPPHVPAPPVPNATKHPIAATTSAPPKQKSVKDNARTSKVASSANSSTPARKPRKPYTMTKARELWSPEEHARFVQALKLYDRDWKKIEVYIGTKTVLQIRSHAQKHFGKVTKYKTGEYIPPPRPKKRAALPYPRARSSNSSKPAAPSSGTASDSGNGSENGTANGSAINGNSSEGLRPLANGAVRHAEPIMPHQPALAPVPPIPSTQKWAPNGYVAPGSTNHPSGMSSLYKAMPPSKPRNDRSSAHIHNLVDPPQPSPSYAPGTSSHLPNTFATPEERRPPGPVGSAPYEPPCRFTTSNDSQRPPIGVRTGGSVASDISNPNNSLHVLSNCVDMMTRDALPPRQPAAGWASAAAARRAHRAKVVRSRKSSRPSSPSRDKDGARKEQVQNGKHGAAAVDRMLLRPLALSSAESGRKNGLVQNGFSSSANNMVQKRERSPPIVQTDEERKRVSPPDSQRSSANSSNGDKDVNGEFIANGRPSASDTGNGLSSGGSGTGVSPDISDSGLAEDEPRSSNDGSGDDGHRPGSARRDSPPVEPISSTSTGNSLKRGSSISHLLSDPSTTVVQSDRSSQPAGMAEVCRVAQNCAVEAEMSNGDTHNSQRCTQERGSVVQKGTKLHHSKAGHAEAGAFRQSMYIEAEKKERSGVSVGKQGHHFHANRVSLCMEHELKQHQHNGHVSYGGAPDVGTKRPRSPRTAERAGCNEVEDGSRRDRKAQRTRHLRESQSLKADYGGNDGTSRPATNGPARR